MAGSLLSEEEYYAVSSNMTKGIQYFAPGFEGTDDEALRLIVDSQLSPSVLARSAFCERALENDIELGCGQYVIFASGYDTFALRSERADPRVYELDLPEMVSDKKRRVRENDLEEKREVSYVPCDLSKSEWVDDLVKAGFEPGVKSFGSLLGISYYLRKDDFESLLKRVAPLWSEGSALCFDYPVPEEGTESAKNRELAAAAGEEMQAKYSYEELEAMLSGCGFLIYEHLDKEAADEQLFGRYNEKCPEHKMTAPKGVDYCLAVKKK
jgi:methyltransferase (TIGR00027 family)